LTKYATKQVPTLHFHFDPTFVHSLSFQAILGGQRGAGGREVWWVSRFGPKPKNIKEVSLYFVIKNLNIKTLYIKIPHNIMQVLQNIISHNQMKLLQILTSFRY
jgi:hypothetical protein